MPKFAKIDHHLPEVSEVIMLEAGETAESGFIPCPEEVEPGWTYSAGHWGNPAPPVEEDQKRNLNSDDDNPKSAQKQNVASKEANEQFGTTTHRKGR